MDASELELELTIMNVRGNGLSGGHFKVYANSPTGLNLLAVGGDFGFMDRVRFTATIEGLISLKGGDPSHQSTPSVPNLVLEGSSDVKDHADLQAETRNSLDEEPEKSKLFPTLVALVVSAMAAGLFLIGLAYKRRSWTACPESRTNYIDDEPLTDDEGSWNVERGWSLSESEYSTDNPRRIEPPEKYFPGIEATQNTIPPSEEYNYYNHRSTGEQHSGNAGMNQHQDHFNEITNPGASVEENKWENHPAIPVT
jgi:hypothetical protein